MRRFLSFARSIPGALLLAMAGALLSFIAAVSLPRAPVLLGIAFFDGAIVGLSMGGLFCWWLQRYHVREIRALREERSYLLQACGMLASDLATSEIARRAAGEDVERRPLH